LRVDTAQAAAATAAVASISNTSASGLRAEAPAGHSLGRTYLSPASAITD
jgi:hypothetical protein